MSNTLDTVCRVSLASTRVTCLKGKAEDLSIDFATKNPAKFDPHHFKPHVFNGLPHLKGSQRWNLVMLALTTFAWLRLLGSRDFAREFLNQLRYLDIEFLAKWRSTLFANRKNRKCANCTFAALWSATYLKDSSTSMLIDGPHQKRRNHYSPLRL